MRDQLPKKVWLKECSIINLDSSTNAGTHWVCYVKNGNNVLYYDSFGDMTSPENLVKYLKNCVIHYNIGKNQTFGSTNCGKLRLEFLKRHALL